MGLHENILKEPVEKISLRKAITVEPSTTVLDAVKLMRADHLGCVIVAESDRKPLGLFTESTLITLLAEHPDQLNAQVGSHMNPQWACVKKTDAIATVLEAMESQNLRFVCVVNENGQAEALTGQRGLMEYIAEHFPRQVLVERIDSNPYPDSREGA